MSIQHFPPSASSGGSGITQLTGDVTAGPGTGSQVATIAAGAVTEAKITLADNTTDNVSSTKHGFTPKSPADATKFLNGAATPAFAQVKDSDLSTSDITTDNVSSTKHGFAPKSPADAAQFLNGAATPAYAAVKDSDLSTSDITTNNVSTSKHGFTPKLPNDATKFLDGTGAYTVPAGTSTGTVTTTGSPASGNLTKFSGASSITNGNLSGDVTTTDTLATTISNDAVTYAKLQNISATSRVLGRKTAGSGDAEELTFSEVLDFVGSAAQGDILYRGASNWARLGAGTSGQFLKTNGPGSNPSWASVSGSAGTFPFSFVAPPAAAGFTGYNTTSGSSTSVLDDQTNCLRLLVPTGRTGASDMAVYAKSMGGNTKLTVAWAFSHVNTFPWAAIGFREHASQKMHLFMWEPDGDLLYSLHMDSPTSAATVVTNGTWYTYPIHWIFFQLEVTGGNRVFRYSTNFNTWQEFTHEGSGTYITADEWCFGINNHNSNAYDYEMSIFSWQES